MPSPFPGMDPFLEDPAVFAGFHNRFVTHLSEILHARLPAPYYADMADRVWVEMSRRPIEPDVNVLRAERPTPAGAARPAGAAVTAPVVVHVPYDERREAYVEIYARHEEERLVTTIEVLSPSNKTPGEQGRELYLRKQREVLGGKVHLVEIDLLRGGQHTTAVPPELARERAGTFEYHVCVHHFDNLEDYFVYPVRLTERLPVVDVPLLPGDGSVALDLQGGVRALLRPGALPATHPLSGARPTPAAAAGAGRVGEPGAAREGLAPGGRRAQTTAPAGQAEAAARQVGRFARTVDGTAQPGQSPKRPLPAPRGARVG